MLGAAFETDFWRGFLVLVQADGPPRVETLPDDFLL